MIDHTTLFKVLDGTRPTIADTDYRYPVGRWTRHIDEPLRRCEVGYHLVPGVYLLRRLGPTIYEAEVCGDHEPLMFDVEVVTCRVRLVRKLRWDDRIARLFAADCAEAALLGERACGRDPDARSWAAVDAARAFARGEISDKKLAAAGYAARSAAGSAAWSAAWSAAGSAAWSAAWSAAGSAAWSAAWSAAGSAARSAAWSAAGSAARSAAWSAARSAESAAGSAARSAARSAAESALFDRLCGYLSDQPLPPVEPLYGAAA